MKTVKTYRGNKEKPVVVCDYNQSMSAVDTADQMLTAAGSLEGNSMVVWYKKFFLHLLNFYIIHSKEVPARQ